MNWIAYVGEDLALLALVSFVTDFLVTAEWQHLGAIAPRWVTSALLGYRLNNDDADCGADLSSKRKWTLARRCIPRGSPPSLGRFFQKWARSRPFLHFARNLARWTYSMNVRIPTLGLHTPASLSLSMLALPLPTVKPHDLCLQPLCFAVEWSFWSYSRRRKRIDVTYRTFFLSN